MVFKCVYKDLLRSLDSWTFPKLPSSTRWQRTSRGKAREPSFGCSLGSHEPGRSLFCEKLICDSSTFNTTPTGRKYLSHCSLRASGVLRNIRWGRGEAHGFSENIFLVLCWISMIILRECSQKCVWDFITRKDLPQCYGENNKDDTCQWHIRGSWRSHDMTSRHCELVRRMSHQHTTGYACM